MFNLGTEKGTDLCFCQQDKGIGDEVVKWVGCSVPR